jgi:hypothetical protein
MSLISKKISLRIRTSESNRVYAGFAQTATDAELMDFADAVNSVQAHPLTEVRRIDDETHEVNG